MNAIVADNRCPIEPRHGDRTKPDTRHESRGRTRRENQENQENKDGPWRRQKVSAGSMSPPRAKS
jgi:hypothetical protein